tara:strand:+ start:289 stop:2037 length:1749 start_codon:yes stop_codon:yes gene_type:complete
MNQTVTQYNDPNIEAYRLGLLGDTQGLVRNQQIGRQVQGLRGQLNPATGLAYTDTEIAAALSTAGTGVEGEEGYVAPTTYDPKYISSISQDAVFQPPDQKVAGLTGNQTQAIDLASSGVGSYQPFLDTGMGTIGQGVGAVNQGIGSVNQGVDFATQGTNAALTGMQGASNQGQGVASLTSSNARALNAPFGAGLNSSTQGALGAAAQGQFGANQAANLARQSTLSAQNQLGAAADFGLGTAKSGIAQLGGASAEFDPSGIGAYNSPYQDQVVEATLADLERVAARRERAARDTATNQAVSMGAYGSSGYERALDRSINPIQEELDRNTASTIAQVRSQGYESSAQRAMAAFEAARNRQLATAQATGQLGQAGAGTSASAAQAGGQLGLGAEQLAQGSALQGAKLGLDASQMQGANAQALATTGLSIEQLAASTGMSAASLAGEMANRSGALAQSQGSLMTNAGSQLGQLGGQLGQLGVQQAGMGELGQALRRNDVSDLMSTGGIQQTNDQAVLDAMRMNDMQSYQLPFQETGFLSDIYAGVPTSSSTVTSGSNNSASPFMQAATLGIGGLSAAAGAAKAGLF